jgi:hypothetical protein
MPADAQLCKTHVTGRQWRWTGDSLSPLTGFIAGPSSMQTLTLSYKQKMKNKLGFESKAMDAFDLCYKAKQLSDTKAPIYL